MSSLPKDCGARSVGHRVTVGNGITSRMHVASAQRVGSDSDVHGDVP